MSMSREARAWEACEFVMEFSVLQLVRTFWPWGGARSSTRSQLFCCAALKNTIKKPETDASHNGCVGNIENRIRVCPTQNAPLGMHPVDDVPETYAIDEVSYRTRKDADDGESQKALARFGCPKRESQDNHENGIDTQKESVGKSLGQIAQNPPNSTRIADVREVEFEPVACALLRTPEQHIARGGIDEVNVFGVRPKQKAFFGVKFCGLVEQNKTHEQNCVCYGK